PGVPDERGGARGPPPQEGAADRGDRVLADPGRGVGKPSDLNERSEFSRLTWLPTHRERSERSRSEPTSEASGQAMPAWASRRSPAYVPTSAVCAARRPFATHTATAHAGNSTR